MTEIQHIESMEKDLQAITQKVGRMDTKMDKIYGAMMGSEITGDGGLVGRIKLLELEQSTLEKKIDELEKQNNKQAVYMGIVWAACGFIACAIGGYILNLVLKR